MSLPLLGLDFRGRKLTFCGRSLMLMWFSVFILRLKYKYSIIAKLVNCPSLVGGLTALNRGSISNQPAPLIKPHPLQ